MRNQIHFFTEGIKYQLKEKRRIVSWIEGIVNHEQKVGGEINFILTTDSFLQKINIKYLNTNTFTDIISFPFSEEEEIVSGDIYISIDRVKDNAIKYKVTVDDELRRIFVHGVLHLIGYNDISTNEKRRMTAMENKYLKIYRD